MAGQSKGDDKTAKARLDALRLRMKQHRLDAYLVPSADAHLNEYLPKENQRRQFMSGFSGSAGDLLVTKDAAWLFVDSRYHEQADTEVDTAVIALSKLGQPAAPTLSQKLSELAGAKKSYRLGIDPFTLPVATARALGKTGEKTGQSLKLVSVPENLVDAVWGDRPEPVNNPVVCLADQYAGEGARDKLKRVRAAMKAANADILPVTKLDQIAWLFNLRGSDVPYNPVFIAYAIVTAKTAILFTETKRVNKSAQKALEGLVTLKPYEKYAGTLAGKVQNKRVLIDSRHTTLGTAAIASGNGGEAVEADHPVETFKAIKNAAEIRWMRAAHEKAGRAKFRAFLWLAEELQAGRAVSEKAFADRLEGQYAGEEDFMGLSFNTICGIGSNSSIVHYGTPNPERKTRTGDWMLVDSGTQYLGGTTDATRTTVIGTPNTLQKQRYTAVLQAHINCAGQVFPEGTTGKQLDAITRAALWKLGLDYGHGTGHGVGAFLNVHEGPQSISIRGYIPLAPGMVVSIEPGYYEPGWGGIRLENLYLVKEVKPGNSKDTRRWFGFEPLTLLPFDMRLVDQNLLSVDQLHWLEHYHQAVVDKLGPTLADTEREQLLVACQL